MNKIFAIGDIHGCYDQLQALMDKVPIDFEHDRLVFLGDYIDRGPDSFKVVEYLINLKREYSNTVFLKGNHEEMLELYLKGMEIMSFVRNGGHNTLESYSRHSGENDADLIPQSHLVFFQSLLLFYETENYIFVHAGLQKGVPLEKQKTDYLLWIRNGFIRTRYKFEKRVIFGHTYFREPLIQPNKIGIDTGAVYGNKLTCIELPDMKFYQVQGLGNKNV